MYIKLPKNWMFYTWSILIWFFIMIFILSISARVRCADAKSLNPVLIVILLLTLWWSCSTILLKYLFYLQFIFCKFRLLNILYRFDFSMSYKLNWINFCKFEANNFSITAAIVKLFNNEIVKTKQFNTAFLRSIWCKYKEVH